MRLRKWIAPLSRTGLLGLATAISVTAGVALAVEPPTALSGDQEVPAVVTSASATSDIAVGKGMLVSGGVVTTGIEGTAAHIHEGAAGVNGPAIVTLTKSSPTSWTIPDGTKLTTLQYTSYMAGKLYVNVHSDAHKDGEIRLQLHP